MNLLFGAFAFAAAAVVLPLVFHLIRRTPRDRQDFSSLMFLQTTPPRLTKRSRLDDLLLLILRSLAVILLAFAFARPFLRTEAALTLNDVRSRDVVILLDTSASMHRDQVWQEAVKEVEAVLKELEPKDDVALVTFDRETSVRVPLGNDELTEAAQKATYVRNELKRIEPSWAATQIDQALVRAAELFNEGDEDTVPAAQQIVLISDLQTGAATDGLQGYGWPENLPVEIRTVGTDQPTNASLLPLSATPGEPAGDGPRVRVTNSETATTDQFQVRWASTTADAEQTVSFIVAPGESRVLEVPIGDKAHDRLVLTGDAVGFDNVYYVAPQKPQPVAVHFLGPDEADDPEGLLFYLARAFVDSPTRTVTVEKAIEKLASGQPDLIVVAADLAEAAVDVVADRVQNGGHVLVVLRSFEMAEKLTPLIGDIKAAEVDQADQPSHRLLGEIDFANPLFTPFADPRYNDFTDIRFWQTVPVAVDDGEDLHVIARFDDQSPAMWTRDFGKGRVTVLTSGWDPQWSQLGLSNKFVPLLERLLDESLPAPLDNERYLVGDRVALGDHVQAAGGQMLKPDGSEVSLAKNTQYFEDTDLPGVYRLTAGDVVQQFAVNISPAESRLERDGLEKFEQLGVAVGAQLTQSTELERQRALRDQELEQRQKIWKWLLVVVLALLAAEMGVAGRRNQTIIQPEAAT